MTRSFTRTNRINTNYTLLNETALKRRIDRALGGWSRLLPKRVIRALYSAILDEVDLAAYMALYPTTEE